MGLATAERRPLQAGDRVKVYQRPLSNEELEGEATLAEFDSRSEGYGTERWTVRFDGESGAYLRDVKVQNRVR